MNPFAVPSIVAFHAPLADRCTALHPRFICHRQHSGSVPSESADFRGLASPLHDAELSEALARLIARMRKLSAIGKPWAMTERLQLTTEIGTLFLRKTLTKNIALSKIFCCVSNFFDTLKAATYMAAFRII